MPELVDPTRGEPEGAGAWVADRRCTKDGHCR